MPDNVLSRSLVSAASVPLNNNARLLETPVWGGGDEVAQELKVTVFGTVALVFELQQINADSSVGVIVPIACPAGGPAYCEMFHLVTQVGQHWALTYRPPSGANLVAGFYAAAIVIS